MSDFLKQTVCPALPSHRCLRIHSRALERLLKALTDQLHEMEKVMLRHVKGTTLLVPEPLHFLLPEPKGLVTVVYPAGVPDSQLEIQRKVLMILMILIVSVPVSPTESQSHKFYLNKLLVEGIPPFFYRFFFFF